MINIESISDTIFLGLLVVGAIFMIVSGYILMRLTIHEDNKIKVTARGITEYFFFWVVFVLLSYGVGSIVRFIGGF